MFKGAKKEDLRLAAIDLGESITDKLTVAELTTIIKSTDKYKTEPGFVEELINDIIENRKCEEKNELELEKIKLEKVKTELELMKLKAELKKDNSNETESQSDKIDSLDTLVKSVRVLTLKIPTRPEGWGMFFSSLERAFLTKNVPEKFKSEILLNLLGEKASNVITYIKDEELSDYFKIKTIVLREFEPTPQTCLDHFRKTVRQSNETHVQFSSRLTTSFDYYLKLRKVTDFDKLKQLIIADKLFQSLDKETASFISVRQAESWFEPVQLGKEVDLYFGSCGRSINTSSTTFQKNSYSKNVSKTFLAEVKNTKCVLCNDNHHLHKCQKYLRLSVRERIDVVKKHNLCFNCLSFHRVINCKSKYSCSICKKKHNTTLHFSSEQKNSDPPDSVGRERAGNEWGKEIVEPVVNHSLSPLAPEFVNKNDSGNNLFAGTSYISNTCNAVVLSTANCYLNDVMGEKHRVRCLLDVGSMSCFVSKECADLLQLKKNKINIVVSGLGDSSMTIKSRVTTKVSNRESNFEMDLNLLVVPRITDFTPTKPLNISVQEFSNVKLADENFHVPGRIDLLLGAEIFYELLRPGKINFPSSKLVLQNTVFGYVVGGSVPTIQENKLHCGLIKDKTDLNEIMAKFWEIENIEEIEIPKNKETIICEEHFEKNYMRNSEGRYIVKMPLKDDPACLGKSKDIALKKLDLLWNRLIREPEYLELYRDFLHEYNELGHMHEIKEGNEQEGTYYMPHLGVYRPDKNTTKLRVVFNCSSQTTNGYSLNSLQYNGGVIQEDLFAIMVRFRKHIFAFTADIEKMYRAILIHPSQRNLQRILWKEELNGSIKTFELATVTYGTVSAPFLAMRTLKQISIDEAENFPLAAPILLNDFYMDDVLTGANTLSETRELQFQLTEMLRRGGMKLHKWCSNSPKLAVSDKTDYIFSNPEETKALGIIWKPIKDCFSFNVKVETNITYTKRDVLSTIARIFDPLGLLGPVVTKAKIFLQKLWLLKIDWSDPLPLKEGQEWQKFIECLQSINNIDIERCILTEGATTIELHGFADASELAYGAVVYCKSRTVTGEVAVKLISSKSRVSPIKQTTIPRLELLAAVLLAKLMHRVKASLKLDVFGIYFWSDSMIVLLWIQKESFQLKTFVANRVATIHELTTVQQWRHVSSADNPSDLISRGMEPEKLLQSKLWWNGPIFLTKDEYPNRDIPTAVIQEDFNCELKNCNVSDFKCLPVLNVITNSFINDLLSLSNKYNKIIRVLSFIFRFRRNCKSDSKKTGPLDLDEIKEAESCLIKLIQREEFKKDIKSLKETGRVSSDSQVKSLNPFIDKEGILRVGGRLTNSSLNFEKKFPIILPSKHKLTYIIVEYYHQKYLHLGPQALLYQVRQKFWPINGRNMCRKIVHKCIICFKAKPVMCNQIMGNLPEERVNENFPFNCSGVDFCGPFWIRYKSQRKGTYQKIYVAIFVCFVTRAIHLELVTDLTSQAFIATLKRFFSRRGKSSNLFSDNAKNFVGSNIELKKLHNMVIKPDETLSEYLCSESVNWKFLPPRAPNFGGLWEAGVKSFKYHLKRAVGKSKLTFEEFLTVTAQVEGILNSRPLTPLSTDIDDLTVLTPGHFLIGRPITSIVEPSLNHIEINRLKLYQRVTKIVQSVWKQWSNNYLSNLQQRSKWFFEKDNVKIGDLVIIKEDNVAVCNWHLGRLVEVFPGKDDKIRVVTVKTQQGVFKRPISKICILPIEK